MILEAIDGSRIEINDVHAVTGFTRGAFILERIYHGEIPIQLRDLDQEVMARLQRKNVRDLAACAIIQKIVQCELTIYRFVHELEQKVQQVGCSEGETVLGRTTDPRMNPVRLAAERDALYASLPEHYHQRVKDAIIAVINESEFHPDNNSKE